MTLERSCVGDVTVLRVGGRIGVAEADELALHFERVFADGCWRVVLDATDMDYLTSTGLGVLMGAMRKIRSHGEALRVVQPQPLVLDILRTTKMTKLLSLFPSLDEALRAD